VCLVCSRAAILLIVSLAVVVSIRVSAGPPPEDPLALRVLVELRVDRAALERDPTATIREAGDRLERALASAGIANQVVRRYDTIPWIALRIAPASRERLAALPEVASLREDRVEKVQPSDGK